MKKFSKDEIQRRGPVSGGDTEIVEDTQPLKAKSQDLVSDEDEEEAEGYIESEKFDLLESIKTKSEKFLENLKKRIGWRGNGDGLLKRFSKNPGGCFIYGLIASIFMVIWVGIIGLSFLIIQYFSIAAGLPSVDDLRQYASQFETTKIYDRNGNLIYEILDPNAGRRTFTHIEEISPEVIAATIATEDKDFYDNPGFDPWGIMRALWQNYTSGEVVSGASTITQQLARTLLLSPEERVEISTRRKAREIVLAAEITRKYSKDEILELYLNEVYYGNLAYGIEAAAETYFNTTADQLDIAQASFLAGLPQAPAVYDIFTYREASLNRHLDVLNLMYILSEERGCIEVNSLRVPESAAVLS